MKSKTDDVKKRVQELVNEFGGSKRDFAQLVGIEETTLSKLLKLGGQRVFTEIHLRQIESATKARLEWMQSGEEPRLHPKGTVPDRPPVEHDGQRLRSYLDRNGINDTELVTRMGRSKSTVSKYFDTASFAAKNKEAILTALEADYDDVFGNGKPATKPASRQPIRRVISQEETVKVVRIPTGARASFNFDEFFEVPCDEDNCVDIPTSWLKKGKLHAVVEVNGDSMQNTLQSGHEVLAYLVDPNDWAYVEKIIVVEFRDHFVIKRVKDNNLLVQEGILTLSSDNPASGATFRVAKHELRRIWQVIRNIGGPL